MSVKRAALQGIIGLGLRYGPAAYERLVTSLADGPPNRSPRPRIGARSPRRMALEHAAHILDGSILPVYVGDTRVWVVFSGEMPIATHPTVDTPFGPLLQHADLDKRRRPGASPRQRSLSGLRRSRSTTAPRPPEDDAQGSATTPPGATRPLSPLPRSQWPQSPE